MAVFVLTGGVDNFTGVGGEDNTFQFTSATLQSTDSVTGGANIDILSLTSPGTIIAAQFAGVTNVEQLDLPDGTNNVTLTSVLVAGISLAAGSFLVNGGSGADTIDGSAVNNGIPLTIAAAGGSDTITGGTGDDVIHGGPGADSMSGGLGNDIYFVDDPGDLVIEAPGEGNDIIYASVGRTMGPNLDSIVLIEGAGDIDAAGNDDPNALIGNSGNNALDGRGGDDTMIGGAGNDSYVVDSSGDAIIENADEGNDIVHASADFTLPANVDSIVLIEGAGDINAAGNGDVNALIGNSGNNTLDGKGGDDTMQGGA